MPCSPMSNSPTHRPGISIRRKTPVWQRRRSGVWRKYGLRIVDRVLQGGNGFVGRIPDHQDHAPFVDGVPGGLPPLHPHGPIPCWAREGAARRTARNRDREKESTGRFIFTSRNIKSAVFTPSLLRKRLTPLYHKSQVGKTRKEGPRIRWCGVFTGFLGRDMTDIVSNYSGIRKAW